MPWTYPGSVAALSALSFSDDAVVEPGRISWRFTLGAHGARELCVEVGVRLGATDRPRRFRCDGDDGDSVPRRYASWLGTVPVVETEGPARAAAVAGATEDLGALRIFDSDHPELPIVAAGALGT